MKILIGIFFEIFFLKKNPHFFSKYFFDHKKIKIFDEIFFKSSSPGSGESFQSGFRTIPVVLECTGRLYIQIWQNK